MKLRRLFSISKDLREIYQAFELSKELQLDPYNPYTLNIKKICLSSYRAVRLEYHRNLKPLLETEKYQEMEENLTKKYDLLISTDNDSESIIFTRQHENYTCETKILGFIEQDEASKKENDEEDRNFYRKLRKYNVSLLTAMKEFNRFKKETEEWDPRYMFSVDGKIMTGEQAKNLHERVRSSSRKQKALAHSDLFNFEPKFWDVIPFEIRISRSDQDNILLLKGKIVDLFDNQ